MARAGRINISDEIKSRCDIVDVIGRVVQLKRAGGNFKGLCPFHKEKTPSFVVSESKQIFTCFGCGASGDVIGFVKQYYSYEFREAVEFLAKDYGIDIGDAFQGYSSKEKDEFYNINREAAIFFYRGLREKPNPGYPYMRNRGISDQTLYDFGIGYADGEWTSLTDYLVGKGFDKEKLVEVGLVSKSKGRYYDKFRNRVMFPIRNASGKVIGFGGRIIENGEPKYLNSQESIVFQKKYNLYGLDLTRKFVTQENQIILVEGYMDVISLYQAGVRNVSASLGTALTENQANLIKRYTKNVVLSYDADDAGQKAAMRGVDILYKEGCLVKVLKVTDGKDPDEFIKKNGRSAFEELVKDALPYGDFKLQYVRKHFDIEDEQQRLTYVQEALNILREMKPTEADLYIRKLAAETGISQEAIQREFRREGQISPGPIRERSGRGQGITEPQGQVVPEVEKDLLKLMLLEQKYTNLPNDISTGIFQSSPARDLHQAILNVDDGRRPMDLNAIRDHLEQESAELLDQIDEKVIPADKEDIIYGDCIDFIRNNMLKAEEQKILMSLEIADESVSQEELRTLMQRLQEIQNILLK